VILDAWFALRPAAPFGDGLERLRGLPGRTRVSNAGCSQRPIRAPCWADWPATRRVQRRLKVRGYRLKWPIRLPTWDRPQSDHVPSRHGPRSSAVGRANGPFACERMREAAATALGRRIISAIHPRVVVSVPRQAEGRHPESCRS